MHKSARITSIDSYIETASPDVRVILEEIRQVIKAEVPAAAETISYQMPALKLAKAFIYFAAFRKHIGIYPPVKGDATLQKALLPYRSEKGNLKFPLDRPMPYKLIGAVARTLSRERG